MEIIKLDEEAFYKHFTLIENKLVDDAPFDGFMFETFGNEVEFIKAQDPKKIWTIIEEDGVMTYQSGWHIVNRLGYFISEEEVSIGIEYYVELID